MMVIVGVRTRRNAKQPIVGYPHAAPLPIQEPEWIPSSLSVYTPRVREIVVIRWACGWYVQVLSEGWSLGGAVSVTDSVRFNVRSTLNRTLP